MGYGNRPRTTKFKGNTKVIIFSGKFAECFSAIFLKFYENMLVGTLK